MAGIGFELRKLLDKDSYLGMLQAYGFAGMIGSGPWVLSIVGIALVGVLGAGVARGPVMTQYWSSVTYVIASSLILTGFLQLHFTRFVADRCYEHKEKLVLPNLMGALVLTTSVTGLIGGATIFFFDASVLYRVLLVATLVVTSGIWIVVVFVTGLKAYGAILKIFLASYSTVVGLSFPLASFGLEGLIAAFLIGHAVLFFSLLGVVIHRYPSDRFIGFEFLSRKHSFYSLALTGFFYNVGLWADKIVFWIDADTSILVLEPLRASPLYDLPVFLAYLSLIPGMAVFLLRVETDFAEYYDRFYDAVRGGGTLLDIERLRNGMVLTIRQAVFEIFKVQGWTVGVLCFLGAPFLEFLGLSPVHAQLFKVMTLGVGLLVVLLSVLNVFFYLDNRSAAAGLCLLFALLNFSATIVSIGLGPAAYGFGFVVAAGITSAAGLLLLSRQLDQLEFETFMLRN